MKIGEDSYCKVHPSPRLPRVVLTPNLQHGRQDPPNPEARKSTDHHSEQSEKCEETRRTRLEETRRAKYEETRRSHLEDTRRKHLEENHRAK